MSSHPLALPRPRAVRMRRLPALQLTPVLVVLALGLVQLARNVPLWYDEEYTLLAAGVPLPTLLSAVWNRTGVIDYLMDVPPSFNAPYYALMHAWGQLFGLSDFSLRMPSVLAAAAAAGVLAELARRLGGSAAGWTAGLLVSSGALYLDEAAQARSYGLALLAVSLSALWFDSWRRTGRGIARTAIAAAVAGLLHWFALPVVLAFAVGAAFRGRAGIRMWVALLVACIPAAALVVWSFAGGATGAPHPAVVGLLLPVDAVVDWTGGIVALAIVIGALALFGLVRSRDPLLICWVVVPLVLITALELIRPSYFPRYLLFTLVGVIVAAAVGAAALRPRFLRPLVAGVAVAASLWACLPLFQVTVREPGPQAIAYLASHQTAGEPIIPSDGRTSLDLMTYLDAATRLEGDLVLPPELFTTQTTSSTVWLVRVVLHTNSLAVVPAEQRLIDAGWTMTTSDLLQGSNTDLRIEKWTR